LIRHSPGSMQLLPSKAYFDQVGLFETDSGLLHISKLLIFIRHDQDEHCSCKQNISSEFDDFRSANMNGVEYHVLAAEYLWSPVIYHEHSCLCVPALIPISIFFRMEQSHGEAKSTRKAGDWKVLLSVQGEDYK